MKGHNSYNLRSKSEKSFNKASGFDSIENENKNLVTNSSNLGNTDQTNSAKSFTSVLSNILIPTINIAVPNNNQRLNRNHSCSSEDTLVGDEDFFSPNSNGSPNLENFEFSSPKEKPLTMTGNLDANPNEATATAAAAAAAASQIVNCLKIPDAVKDLPKFDGNPRLLFEFINNVEEILSLTIGIDGTAYSKILLRAIRNKIEGPANEVLNMYGTPLEWEHIRNNLILHYSDKRNETSLIRDLHNLRQHNSTVEKFYSEIIELQATMSNHIQIHETNLNVVKAKSDLFSEMCLETFLTGLREPLGSTIRAMKPESLATAFSYCIKEQNISYAKNISHQMVKPKPNVSQPNLPHFRQNTYQRPFFRNPPYQQYHKNTHQEGMTPNIQQKRFIPYNQQHRTNPFYTPNFPPRQLTPFNQQFRTPNPNPTNRPNPFKAEPMDTSSGNTHLRRPPSRGPNQQQPQPKYFNKELFNVNETNPQETIYNDNIYSNDNYYTNLDRYYNYGNDNSQTNSTDANEIPELDDSNFRISGQTNRSDT